MTFEKITDFDGSKFENLWGGFSCKCIADGIVTFLMFYKDGEERFSLSGNDANEVLDFVLSEYYKNDNTKIEDGFSTWLLEYYDDVVPTFEKNSEEEEVLPTNDMPFERLYNNLLKDWKRQNKIISRQKITIKKLKAKLENYSLQNHKLRVKLEEITGKVLSINNY